MANYKRYQDKRGNNIEYIDEKWQMYDDGGYYVLDESVIPPELLTPAAKAKAKTDYLRYITEQNASVEKSRERAKALEESAKKEASGKKDGLTIKSQVKGWKDWSTDTLPPKVREAAEWLIANGHSEDKDVKQALYRRQTSSMSDDFNAEEQDNNRIINLAEAYKIKKSKESAEPAPFSKAMRTMLQSQKDNGANEGYDPIGKTSVKDFDRALDDNRKLQSELRSVKDKALKILGFNDNTKSVKKGGESKMAKYKNPAIKGWDKDGKPIGDPDLIILMDEWQTLRENVYPSKKELQEIDKAVKKGTNKTLGENLYESSKKGGEKNMAETNPKPKRIGYKNPSKRASGFAKSLKKGSGAKLTPTQVSFRSGYLQAQKDGATAYKLKKGMITFKDLIEK